MSKLYAFLKDESGATAIEYGLIAAGISVVIIATVNAIGSNLNGKFNSISTQLKWAVHTWLDFKEAAGDGGFFPPGRRGCPGGMRNDRGSWLPFEVIAAQFLDDCERVLLTACRYRAVLSGHMECVTCPGFLRS
jgi:pilus assembly protein Flp/PilA